jgi:uncharacterized protein YdbL (DUF1318 family)
MNHPYLFRILFLIAASFIGSTLVRAENLGAVKARIEQRLASVDALKDRGLIGENNRGFVEARGTVSAAEQRLVADENADRQAVYAAIAAKSNESADAVGRARAHKIAATARPGHWIQDAGGVWKKK